MSNNKSSRLTLHHLLTQVTQGFQSLRGSPSELWKAYLLKFLDSYSYFSFSIIFTLFLSADFGFTDIEAGSIYGLWGALITIYGLVAGCIIDNLGVAKSLRIGFAMSLVSRCFLFWTTSKRFLLFNVCVLLPMGNCLGIPVLTTGIRRYTNDENRGFAFGLFYVIMNVAALLSGPIVDMCTILYKDQETINSDERRMLNEEGEGQESESDEWSLSGYRLVVLSGIITNIIAVWVTFTVREIKLETKVEDDDDDDEQENNSNSNLEGNATEQRSNKTSNKTAKIATFHPLQGSAWQILKETTTTKSFWRFLTVCLISLNVRMIFRHLDATLPKYMIREFGENTPKGTIYSINPALIIILVPIVTAATTKVDPLVMIHIGSYISAASVFALVVSTSVGACVVFVIILSIGEAIWSPRLYDYTMSVVREGREGTYMALSSAPLFLAKLPVGFMSGILLQNYCPEDGPRNSQMMWLIIAVTTATSPILMTLCWPFISKKDDDGRTTQYDEVEREAIVVSHDEQLPFRPLQTGVSLPRVRSNGNVDGNENTQIDGRGVLS